MSKITIFVSYYCISDAKNFLAASIHGSLILYKNDEAFKTVKLKGEDPLVRLINDEIVSVSRYGKLTVLSKKLEVLKTFHATNRGMYTLTGNSQFIAFGD